MTANSDLRKLRTRQLIQLGGLIEKVGLLDLLDVPTGADMQKAFGDKAAILAGGLLMVHTSIERDADGSKTDLLRQKGSELLNEEKD